MQTAGPERVVAGRYRLSAVIGRGGMGVVWQARDELLKRDVAVKELVWPPAKQRQVRPLAPLQAEASGTARYPPVITVSRTPPASRSASPTAGRSSTSVTTSTSSTRPTPPS